MGIHGTLLPTAGECEFSLFTHWPFTKVEGVSVWKAGFNRFQRAGITETPFSDQCN